MKQPYYISRADIGSWLLTLEIEESGVCMFSDYLAGSTGDAWILTVMGVAYRVKDTFGQR